MPPALLFDLDGTLVDSIELILSSARHAFIGFVGHAPTDDEWRASIGRPLQKVLLEYSGGNDVEAERLLDRYRAYQLEHHDRLLHAYDGVVDTLRSLSSAGHAMAVVTSKSDWLALRALEFVGISDLFPVLVGCDTCVNHKPHPEPVERALALLGVEPANALFVGDSPHDIQSGRGAGVFTVGATWGAFSQAEMAASGADILISDIAELPTVVQAFSNKR
ncbi:MAG: HAD-IA family hydrolase [Gemmatimonadota bacterium]|nr:HAD-IA family hydrolase [Gemmatimonadota bacterium]